MCDRGKKDLRINEVINCWYFCILPYELAAYMIYRGDVGYNLHYFKNIHSQVNHFGVMVCANFCFN